MKEIDSYLLGDLKKLVDEYIRLFESGTGTVGIETGMDNVLVQDGWKIGNIEIRNPVVAAPLAGISNRTYRIFSMFFGGGLTYTEMVSSYGIHFDHKKSLELAEISDNERPCTLQIFGSDPDIMADAASRVENIADILDINMGCPVPKILRAKSGGYLLTDEKLIEKIIVKVRSSIKIPLTIKVRLGWDNNNINIGRIAGIAQENGVDAIAIHGRTVKQGFKGNSSNDEISKIRKSINIPLILSGDIDTAEKAKEVLDHTGCDGVMIGRASRGSIWLFMNILFKIAGKLTGEWDPGIEWKKEYAVLFLKFLICLMGEYRAIREFRKFFSWIFRGVRCISSVRQDFIKVENIDDVVKIINSI